MYNKIIINNYINGDPLYEYNLDEVLKLVQQIRISFPEKTIWLYTGFRWEELIMYDSYNSFIPLEANLRNDIYELYTKRCQII